MSDSKAVTFTLPNGTRVTAPKELAVKLGWTEPSKSAGRSRKS